MNGYVGDIEQAALANEDFRRVLYTAAHMQLVVMSLKPGEDIGEEVHRLDQFIRVEKGAGAAILDGIEHAIAEGTAVVIPAGTRHNILNTGAEPLKLYTLYAPPNHKDGTIHRSKAEAQADEEHYES